MKKAKYDVFISYSRKDYVDAQKNVIPGNNSTEKIGSQKKMKEHNN